MLNSYTVLLNRGIQNKLTMLPNGANGVWEEYPPAVVLLDGKALIENIEHQHVDISALWVEIDKIGRLAKSFETGLKDLDMPIYHLSGRGAFDDLVIEAGRHRTFMLLASYGVEFLPALVPAPFAPKFRRLFGYLQGYLTRIVHGEIADLKVLSSDEIWYIGTDFERESIQLFNNKQRAEDALKSGEWNQRPRNG